MPKQQTNLHRSVIQYKHTYVFLMLTNCFTQQNIWMFWALTYSECRSEYYCLDGNCRKLPEIFCPACLWSIYTATTSTHCPSFKTGIKSNNDGASLSAALLKWYFGFEVWFITVLLLLFTMTARGWPWNDASNIIPLSIACSRLGDLSWVTGRGSMVASEFSFFTSGEWSWVKTIWSNHHSWGSRFPPRLWRVIFWA